MKKRVPAKRTWRPNIARSAIEKDDTVRTGGVGAFLDGETGT